MDWLFNYSQYLSVAAIILSFIGTIVIIGKPTWKYYRGYVWGNPEIRKQIEDEAIGSTFNRLAPTGRGNMLADSIARGFITTYKSTFWGFLFILLAFVLQTLSVVSEIVRRTPSS